MICRGCGEGGLEREDVCPQCHRCLECCSCDFDADELGLDPEEPYDYAE